MAAVKNDYPRLPDRLDGLGRLAENLWWSWNPAARMLFKSLDRQAWKDSIHNPDKMLREIPADILERAAGNDEYLRNYDFVLAQFENYIQRGTSLPDGEGSSLDHRTIAYFSAEYGLHHSLPFYAGGLGFLAGDHLKECSDQNVPLVAVGFMYPEGYLKQKIRDDGWQENMSEPLDREAASISRVLKDDGSRLTVKVPCIDPQIYVAVWKVAVGRVALYLLDTDIDENDPWNRAISARLYTGDLEQRLRQEIVLGIGGAEVLEVLGLKPFALHLNEGHAAFALLEQIRDRTGSGMNFQQALERVAATSVFTTHTPVPAGHDVFPFHLMEKYFHDYWPGLKLDRDQFLKLGIHPEKPQDGFNMTALALRLSKFCNAVSRKHGEISRRMWHGLKAEAGEDKPAIDHITNGIHLPTWIEPKMRLLFDRYLGSDWLEDHDNPVTWEMIEEIPDDELWRTHYWLKIKLIDAIRERIRLRWSQDHVNPSFAVAGGTMLDPSVLTLGFARRFATYKRADLIFSDPDRLKRMLNDRWRPVQIIFAGKAHPADDPGKQILQRIFNTARDPSMGGRIAFVEDYGEQLAQYLVHGVDVWLNNPVPPLEASGTSGMKAAVNGVPQLSILDGWWLEGFNGKNGWAIDPDDIGGGDRDRADAAEIYRLLESEIIPLYYDLSEEGIPRGWVRTMKESIKSSAANFSARRMVKVYVKKFYAAALKNLYR
ncbi:MAG: alpha-glucan family phosphorylase [Desulfobacterales bacterium]